MQNKSLLCPMKQKAIIRYPEYFPFSKYWDEIVEIVGADIAFNGLIETSEETGGQFIKFKIPDLNPEFKAFVKAGLLFK